MNIQAALDAPRFSATSGSNCKIGFESRVPPATVEGLRRRGHEITELGAFRIRGVGGGQAVMHDSRNMVNYGASDARGDGATIPEGIVQTNRNR